ncbi:MAG: hypothetical protein WBQ95_14710, partial [Terracidiphilus sp.]
TFVSFQGLLMGCQPKDTITRLREFDIGKIASSLSRNQMSGCSQSRSDPDEKEKNSNKRDR